MGEKIGITKDFLIREYIRKKKTTRQITTEFGCGATTIKRYLKRYRIKPRILTGQAIKLKKILAKQFLMAEYIEKNKTTGQIARELGCHCCTILRKIKSYNIPLKKRNIEKKELFKGENSPTYKHGYYCKDKKFYCKTCKVNEISVSNFLYGNGECRSCARKHDDNPIFRPEVREKVRKRMLLNNPMKLLAIRQKMSETRKERKCGYVHGEGYEPYSKEFNTKLKAEIRARDNYKCQGEGCSITQEEHFIMYGRDIEVHHIDYNKQDCNEKNLITLCKQCNIRANFNRQYWQDYFTKLIRNKEWQQNI